MYQDERILRVRNYEHTYLMPTYAAVERKICFPFLAT
jgi:hypothetical protein